MPQLRHLPHLPRRLALVGAVALAAPALPALAGPAGPPVVTTLVRTTALQAGDTVRPLAREEAVGVTWTAGHPVVQLRWHDARGWGAWTTAEDDSAEPEPAERASTRPGTAPVWRPAGTDRVELRVTGAASGLGLTSVVDGPARRSGLSLHGSSASAASRVPILGEVRSRRDWGADESMRRGRPAYAPALKAVVVHHTAQSNDYAPGDVPRLIRADYAYHVQGRGWSDLGYNLLVDRFGRVWEGRYGGIDRAVVGAHAQGFNTGTLGVSLIGDVTRSSPTAAAVAAMSRVAAFAADRGHFDPRGSVVLTSGGSPRYSQGRRVRLHRVFGHLETGLTSCPGRLQGRLGQIRTAAFALRVPAPRILSTRVTGAPVHSPTPLVVSGRLNRAVRWTVQLTDPAGRLAAGAAGGSAAPRLSWQGTLPIAGGQRVPAPPGTYRWTMRASDGSHAAAVRSGTVQVGLPRLVR